MRIIAGTWRSRRLFLPRTTTTRPMPDRVKESIFNMLGSYYGCPGRLPSLQVADVFSGSGSMGLEALSRGAAGCTFFEKDVECLDALKHNLATIGVGPEATVVRGDAWQMAVIRPNGDRFDLILLDPPFRDSSNPGETGPVRQYLGQLRSAGYLDVLVVLHHEAKVSFLQVGNEGWNVLDERRFGRNAVTMMES